MDNVAQGIQFSVYGYNDKQVGLGTGTSLIALTVIALDESAGRDC